ncbi:MAG: hypothetical protein NC131_15595 [Roseburia sp.]|nr:hypothetical protein [Roseburia sp.]
MLKFITHTRDTRIRDVDYLLEDPARLVAMIPYLRPKIEGEWRIALFEPPIKFVRELLDTDMVPEYVNVDVYLEQSVVQQLHTERPQVFVKTKSAYEKYMDVISDMKVLIDPKAAKELYRRVGSHKEKLPEYLIDLSGKAENGRITVSMVRDGVVDERRTYASEVLMSFLMCDYSRWKKYNELISDLGRDYSFYALRKYSKKLLLDKNKYLRNEETEIRGIDKVDSFKVNQAFILFNTTTPVELDMCMRMLENRESMRRII